MHVESGVALTAPLPHDAVWMRAALAEAEAAAAMGEIPIGAVIVRDGELLAAGHNLRETQRDPTAHAEMVAIRRAAERLGAWRLTGTTLYVTIEPCPMCAGALVLARVERLVYGAADPKAGACGTLWNLVQDPRLNHRLAVTAGVLEEECRAIIQGFFRRLRE
ncbi:MAG TPA: tRNA adenosine(34) deaminase TadA [Limnochordales bacterium]|nr:tRNA adenosine(34) deaminase TadA [Limnochordales bacterium]